MLSPAWKIRAHHAMWTAQYPNLFEMGTDYQASPVDGLELLTTSALTADFLALAQSIGRVRNYYISPDNRNPYSEGFLLGCVTVLHKPHFSNVPAVKIKINPSEGGFTPGQVLDWVEFIVGNNNCNLVKSKKLDVKVDLHGMNTAKCIRRIWWLKSFRKIYDKRSLYLGGPSSGLQLVVYDKASQQKLPYELTRVEVRKGFVEVVKQVPLNQLFSYLATYNPFHDVVLISASVLQMNLVLMRHGNQLQDDSVVKTLRYLRKHHREHFLRSLSGHVNSLADIYNPRIQEWLAS